MNFTNIMLNNETLYCADTVARKNIDIGVNKSIYVSAEGNDSNDGFTYETPVLTWSRVKEIMCNGYEKDGVVQNVGQWSIQLIKGVTLNVDDAVWGQSCPHIYPYDDSRPTINFTYNPSVSSTGFRFYSGRVHIGNSTNRMYITADFGSIYFENCTVGLYNCDIKVPISLTGSFISSENNTFSYIGKTPWWGVDCALHTLYCTGNLRGTTTFSTSDLSKTACAFQQSSDIRVYGTITCGFTKFIDLDHSTVDIMCDFTSTPTSVLSTTKCCIVKTDSTWWSNFKTLCSITQSTVLCGKNLLSDFGSVDGQTITLGTLIVPAIVTNNFLYFYISLGGRKTSIAGNCGSVSGKGHIYGTSTSQTFDFNDLESSSANSYGYVFKTETTLSSGSYNLYITGCVVNVLQK